jgi:hypothetical protein
MVNATQTKCVNNDELTQVAHKAGEAAASVGQMASHAASAVGAMASQAACDVSKKADDLTARAGVGIQELGDRLSHSTLHEGMLGSASQSVARAVKGGGEYIESAKLSGITEDIAQVIRRNPIPAVLIAIGLGWYVGRRLKG